jgi:large subunit ribosomal protein L6
MHLLLKNKKQIIKIPKYIKIFYCNNKKIIIINGPVGTKAYKMHKMFTVVYINQQIEIISVINQKLSNYKFKKIQILKKTTTSLIKQFLVEATTIMYRKLKFIGVGYKAFSVANFEHHLLFLKLGFSHPIYFKTQKKIKLFLLKFTKLFIFGYSYQQLTFIASKIRLNKTPEPYKGKGILFENEQIRLKEGKKI